MGRREEEKGDEGREMRKRWGGVPVKVEGGKVDSVEVGGGGVEKAWQAPGP